MPVDGMPPHNDLADLDRIQELLLQFQPEKIPDSRRIYANRNLRMSGVKAVGFDMDYTLCEYHVSLEELQVELTVRRLIDNLGYPEDLAEIPYDPAFAIRGLVVDKRLGNLLKMDSHRHISHAFHGLKPLSKEKRRRVYRHERISMSAQRYSLIDSLFGVPEAWLFAQLTDLMEKRTKMALKAHQYRRMYDDVRETIDTIHADQSLKTIIKASLATYIRKDPDLAVMLHRFRESGKMVFLMTNSYGAYTTAVMEYLLDDLRPDYDSWKDYFDVIVVGSKKPSFFVSDAPFKQLDTSQEYVAGDVVRFEPGILYEGGNLADFERLAKVSGDDVLYVGDHLYGDILRSKKSSAWRTCMIVPELESELELTEKHRDDLMRVTELETHRIQIDAELHQHEKLLRT
ncbi:MAG: 5'-nucleotidase, partial [Myxococcota bacterium]